MAGKGGRISLIIVRVRFIVADARSHIPSDQHDVTYDECFCECCSSCSCGEGLIKGRN